MKIFENEEEICDISTGDLISSKKGSGDLEFIGYSLDRNGYGTQKCIDVTEGGSIVIDGISSDDAGGIRLSIFDEKLDIVYGVIYKSNLKWFKHLHITKG